MSTAADKYGGPIGWMLHHCETAPPTMRPYAMEALIRAGQDAEQVYQAFTASADERDRVSELLAEHAAGRSPSGEA